jgi:hypothetical protein
MQIGRARFILLLVILFFVCDVSIAKQASTTAKKANPAKKTDTKVIAYYFHGNYRCYTCTKIESYSREAIEAYFADDLKTGQLEFRSVNVDEPANRHFIQDYQLHTRSLVLTLYRNNQQQKWKNLKDVWQLVRDKDRFYKYVKSETEQFLAEAK